MAGIVMAVHKSFGKRVVALCDKDILGKKVEEGSLQLDLTGNFYKGIECGEEEILEELSRDCFLNAVGKKTTDFCVKNGIVMKENILKISGIPHAEAMLTA